jgi:hypothetical protein
LAVVSDEDRISASIKIQAPVAEERDEDMRIT